MGGGSLGSIGSFQNWQLVLGTLYSQTSIIHGFWAKIWYPGGGQLFLTTNVILIFLHKNSCHEECFKNSGQFCTEND